jgi:phage-related protein
MINKPQKPIIFLGDSLAIIRSFTHSARKEAGVELHKLQQGDSPKDWKPMTTIGSGVREIRIRDEFGAFRIIYITKFEGAVYVLHAFQKKTQQTPKRDLDVASLRLKQIS